MKQLQKTHFLGRGLAVMAGLTVTWSGQAQGITGASATLSGVAGSGNTYDYTLVLNNSAAATTSIEGLWYAWVPGAFYLPTQPSSASAGTSGWTAAIVGNSIQFKGGAGDAIAPGGSDTFTFVSTDTPTTLAGDTGGNVPIGTSYAYPGAVGGNVTGAEEFVVQSVPQPSALGLLATGSLCALTFGRKWTGRGAGKAGV